MNHNQIRCFLESARRLSFTGAAAALYLSPQAVSKQVIALEEELDARLFERNGPRLTMTEVGQLYFSLFTGLDRQLNFVLDDIRLYHQSRQTGLSIGVSEWIDSSGPFQDAVDAFRAAWPNCKVSISVFTNQTLLEALEHGTVDCAFFSEAQRPQSPDLNCRTVTTEQVMLYTPEDIGPGPAREDCWGLPLLMVPAWSWSETELRVAGAREMTGVRLSPAETITLPNVQSLYVKMEFSRCATLGGVFTCLNAIPGLIGHPTGMTDELCCLWPRRNDHSLAEQLAVCFQEHFAKK